MDDTSSMCGYQSGSNLDRDIEYLSQLQALEHEVAQSDAFYKLCCNKRVVVFAPDFIDSENVRMVERRRGLGLLNEALEAVLMGRDFAREEFQGYRTAELSVLGSIDLTHSSRTNLANDAIMRQAGSGG